MKEYLDVVREVLENGEQKDPGSINTTVGRVGVPTISYFGAHYKVDLAKGFPLLTTKKVYHKSILHELLWFLKGDTHIKDLKDKTKIWNAWTNEEKGWNLGQTYGHQWVKWDQFLKNKETGQWEEHHFNQIQHIIDLLKNDPTSRRMVVSAWNPADFHRPRDDPKRTVQPSACHTMFMFHVGNGRKLNCHLTQRSGDLMLGVPFNLASYAALTQMLAQECDMKLGTFSHYVNDCHIYANHIEAAREQLLRSPLPLPTLKIAKKPFWDLQFEDFELEDYNPHPPIKFQIAV